MTSRGVSLLVHAVRMRRQNTSQDLIQSVDNAGLELHEGDFRADTGRCCECAKKQGECTGSNERGASGREKKHIDCVDEIHVDELFEVLGR